MDNLLNSPHLDRLIDLALEEDIGSGDVTTQALIPPELQGEAHIRAKAILVVAGLPVAARVFQKLDAKVVFAAAVDDGQEVAPGTVLARLTGPVASILTGERVALNFLQRLSGIATFTRAMAALVAGSNAVLVDTRKTTPGWRALEKYAVRLGGGHNHRLGLYDAVLIKNNHLTAVGSIGEAVRQAIARAHPQLKIEVEVTDLEGLEEALHAGADRILLDNMDDATLRQAVELTGGRAWLEASGGITKERLPKVAATGVNFISMGALTHSAPAVDIHLRLVRTWM
ncbi:MAG: carboxylating nicotinate-nucleotide diphosphorylase [Desulfobacterales bacterium]|nr:carboxylating nicotinate-nucleotide diphosphorylase [Pseudomonadota bacterium]MBU4357403.1 carboxylating nicotinate-nucleotide diphosphorylase [Pseudomonadota bacterium]MCG2770508.1 carboxylating nicotinate-nucleotide diphosphorylase [Desulfobacterales bacterium]